MDQRLAAVSPGQFVRVKTNNGDTLEGVLLASDRASQCLLLQLSPGPGSTGTLTPGSTRTVVFVKQSTIQDLDVVGDPKAAPDEHVRKLLEVPRVDFEMVESRERAAVQREEEDFQLKKLGVTSDAKDLYAALAKTLPVAWEKATILVMGEVRISSPFIPESVTGGSAAARDRVKMVLAKERERLGLKA